MSEKQKIMIAGAALFAALLLFSGVMLCREIKDSQQSAQAFETLAKLVVDKPKLDIQLDGEASRPEDKPSADEPAPEITAAEKYAAIHEKNNDFVGWLRIEDTNINYPVMQSTDNPNFYLKHNFDKEYSNYGVPYVQENCEFFDWNDENGQDGDSDHVGIVEKVENGVVYTVEGNSGDMCQENRYTVGYYEILGYGTPAY